jgi:hypothetical protein
VEVFWFLNGCRSIVSVWGRELWVSASYHQGRIPIQKYSSICLYCPKLILNVLK